MTSWNPPTCSINKLSPGGGGRGEGLSHGTQEGGLCGAAVQCQRARGSHGGVPLSKWMVYLMENPVKNGMIDNFILQNPMNIWMIW